MKKRLEILGALLVLGLAASPLAGRTEEIVQGDLGRSIDRYMAKAEANGYSGLVLVARGDDVILAKGYGWADRELKVRQTAATVFSIGSITKQFTGAAVLKLQMAGKLSVKDPITKYLKGVPADKAAVTLHQLLTHSAGFADALGDDYEPIGREDFVKRAMGSKLRFKPGEKYAYSNVGFSLLGIIVELVSGKGYEDFLREALFLPAGMKQTGYLRPGFDKSALAVGYLEGERWGSALERAWMADGPGWHLRANGGILSTVGDMYRWFLALRGDSILSAAAKAEYFAPQVKEGPDADSYYGYGWVNQKTARGTTLIWHNGGNGIYNAFMGFELDSGLVIIVSSNVSGKISDRYAEKIMRIVLGEDRALDERKLREWSGTYMTDGGAEIKVRFDENDTLTAEYRDGALIGMLAATGRENKEETDRYDARVKEMLSGALAGDFKALASAWDEPFEEVKSRASAFWGGKKARFGEVKALSVLGTAARPRNLLTYARVDFETRTRFFTCVWDKANGRLLELRESDSLERDFEPRSETEFASPILGTKILFSRDPDGTVVITLSREGAETRAVKK